MTMTQEEKQLLLKDLCARLPYSVILSKENEQEFFIGVEYGESFITKDVVRKTPQITTERFGGKRFVRDIEEVKPYLRPMSSMTKEEMEEYNNLWQEETFGIRVVGKKLEEEYAKKKYDSVWQHPIVPLYKYIDWLNSHHFDYQGLIEKGLALEAPENMYKFK